MKITYKSLYPNITLEHNIAPNTLIGRIIIPEKVYRNENVWGTEKYQRSGEFIENMVCDNQIVFCNRWFHLANFNEILSDMDEYFDSYEPLYTSNGQRDTFVKEDNKIIIAPLQNTFHGIDVFDKIDNGINPFIYLGDRPILED